MLYSNDKHAHEFFFWGGGGMGGYFYFHFGIVF